MANSKSIKCAICGPTKLPVGGAKVGSFKATKKMKQFWVANNIYHGCLELLDFVCSSHFDEVWIEKGKNLTGGNFVSHRKWDLLPKTVPIYFVDDKDGRPSMVKNDKNKLIFYLFIFLLH